MKHIPALVTLFLLTTAGAASAQMQSMPTDGGILIVELSTVPDVPVPGEVVVGLNFVNPTTRQTQVHIDYSMEVLMEGQTYGTATSHTTEGRVNIPLELEDVGTYDVSVTVSGIFFNPITPQSAEFTLNVGVDGSPVVAPDPDPSSTDNGGGCLIATAAYGTEMAHEVQALRELRDGTLLTTGPGSSFMSAFNGIYYAFSPTVADLERQSPEFKSVVRTLITPMLASLSLMSLAEGGSDSDVLGTGLAVIALNVGIYAGVPFLTVFGARRLYAWNSA